MVVQKASQGVTVIFAAVIGILVNSIKMLSSLKGFFVFCLFFVDFSSLLKFIL